VRGLRQKNPAASFPSKQPSPAAFIYFGHIGYPVFTTWRGHGKWRRSHQSVTFYANGQEPKEILSDIDLYELRAALRKVGRFKQIATDLSRDVDDVVAQNCSAC